MDRLSRPKVLEEAPNLKALNFFPFFLFYVYGCCLYACLCTMCIQWLWRPGEGVWSMGTGITGSYKLPCNCWESNVVPLVFQLVSDHLSSSREAMNLYYILNQTEPTEQKKHCSDFFMTVVLSLWVKTLAREEKGMSDDPFTEVI